MDAATRKLFEDHNAELRSVVEALDVHRSTLVDVKSALNVMNAVLARVELSLKQLPCHSEPPCNERTPAEAPVAKRRLRSAVG